MRKLKLFSLLAVLLCAATMWAIPTQFNYCYDCWRDPAYPVKGSCNVHNFSNPCVGYNGIGKGQGNVPDGPWKLEFVDYYDPYNDSYDVQGQVENIIVEEESYYSGVDKSTFPIFRLYQWNPSTSAFEHACYGVVVAYANESNAVEHATLFISAVDDYGCYLTDEEHTSGDDFDIIFDADNKTGLGELTNPTPSTPTPAVNGKLPGAFSVSADKQVYFSQGNLQYTKSTGKFSFMTNQYDMVETPDQNVGEDYADQDVVSLFGWGTSGWNNTSADPTSVHYQPYATYSTKDGTDNNSYQYGPSNANVVGDEFDWATSESWSKSDDYKKYDWGVYNSGDLGADWRTLTAQEWKYLFKDRTDASNLRALATVNGVKGVILMPDGWTAGDVSLTITMYSYDTNIINTDNWETLEGQGCVFLPAAHARRGNTIDNDNSGCYWSSTSCSAHAAWFVLFEEDYLDAPTKSSRYLAYSVRLVSETPPASTPDPTPSTPATSDNVDGIEDAMEALVTAGGTTDLIINRTLYKDGCFNTLCLPFSLTEAELAASPLAGCKLYSLSDADDNGDNLYLTITEETSIEAGMPYLIKWSYGSDITSMTFTGVTVTASTGSTVTKGNVQFVGTIGRSTLPSDETRQSYLFLGAGDNLYYPESGDVTSMKGFRAYFIVDNASGDVPRHAPARLVIAPKVPAAVDQVQGDNVQSTKVIENGQLYIIKNGVKYNAQGKVVK
ncbi:MAG: hypothetical protein IJ718_06610 [Paludibacteraceae bacterium]|nr:hypothetical protein [Paludibacteraceae bacterium]MBR1922442.1 hypothetical protein [Paludibacteraceae bacterium]